MAPPRNPARARRAWAGPATEGEPLLDTLDRELADCHPQPDRLSIGSMRCGRRATAPSWFGILTRQAIRRGSFRTVKELVAMIETFISAWNAGSGPFTWVRTADEILAKAVRKPRATSRSGH